MILLKVRLDSLAIQLASNKASMVNGYSSQSSPSAMPNAISPTNSNSKTMFAASSAYLSSVSSKNINNISSQPQEIALSLRFGYKIASTTYHHLPTAGSASGSSFSTPTKGYDPSINGGNDLSISFNEELVILGDLTENSLVSIDLYARVVGSEAPTLIGTSTLPLDILSKSKRAPTTNAMSSIKFALQTWSDSVADEASDRSNNSLCPIFAATLTIGNLSFAESSVASIPKAPKLANVNIQSIFEDKNVESFDGALRSMRQGSSGWSEQTKISFLTAFDVTLQGYNSHKAKALELMTSLDEANQKLASLEEIRRQYELLQASHEQANLARNVDIAPTSSEIDKLTALLKSKETLIESLRSENDKLRQTIDGPDSKGKTNGKTSKSGFFGSGSSHDDSSKTEVTRLKAEVNDLKASVETLKQSTAKYQKAFQASEQRCNELNKALVASNNQCMKLATDLEHHPSEEKLRQSRMNGETSWALLDVEMKITTAFTDLRSLLTHESVSKELKEIREYAAGKGSRISSLLEQQDELESVVTDLTKQLTILKRNDRTLSKASEYSDPFSPPLPTNDSSPAWQTSFNTISSPSPMDEKQSQQELFQARELIKSQNEKLSQAEEYIKYQDELVKTLTEEVETLKSISKTSKSESNNASMTSQLKEAKDLIAAYELKLQQAAEYVSYQQDQYTALEEELKALQASKPTTKSNESSTRKEIDSKEIEELKATIKSYEAKLQQGAEYVKYLQEQHAIAEEELLKQSDKDSTMTSYKEQIAKYEQRIKDNNSTIISLEHEVETLKKRCQMHDADDKGWEDVVKDLNARLEEAISHYTTTKTELETMTEENKDYKDIVHTYEEKLKQAAEYVSYQRDQYTALEEECESYKTQIATLTADMTSKLSNREAELRVYMEERKKEYDDKMKKQAIEYEAKIEQGVGYLKDLKKQHEAAEMELNRLRKLESEMETKDEFFASQSKEYEDEINQLRQQLSELSTERDDLQSTNDTYEEKLQQAKDYVTYLQDQYTALEEEANALRSNQSSGSNGSSSDEVIELKSLISNYEEKLRQGAEYVKYLQEQHTIAEEEMERLREMNASYEQQLKNNSQNKSMNATANNAANNEKQLQVKIQQLEEKLKSNEKIIEAMKQQQAINEKEIIRLKEIERENESIDEKIAQHLKSLNDEIITLKQKITDLQEINQEYEEKLSKAAEYVNYLHDQQAALQEELNSLQNGNVHGQNLSGNGSTSGHMEVNKLKINQLEQEISHHKETIEILISRQEEAVKLMREKELLIHQQDERIKSLQYELQTSSQSNSAMATMKQTYEKDMKLLKDEINEMKKSYQESLLEHDGIVSQLIDVKMKHAQLQDEYEIQRKKLSLAQGKINELTRRLQPPQAAPGPVKQLSRR